MEILSTDLIRKSEENAVLSGAFSYRDLMLTAGNTAAKIIIDKFDIASKKIAVFCGNGNNGGDGFVVAKALYEHGADVTVFMPMGTPKTENALYYYNALPPVHFSETLNSNTNFDIIIDAVFGIGLNREIEKELSLLFEKINSMSALKIAIDVPSGINADTGKVFSCAVKADFTITFIALKPCFVLPFGSDYCGETVVADIGVKPVDYTFKTIEKPVFSKRPRNCHKGSFGTALLIGGSYGMAGAAMLSAKAALRSGVGIAKCVLCDGIYAPFTSFVPEAVCVPIKQTKNGTLNFQFVDINVLSESATACLFGCGVGIDNSTEKILENIIKYSKIPLVIDADGINLLSRRIELLKETKVPIIITPHPKEMARLCGITVKEVEENRIEISKNFAKNNGIIVVLKGANTIVALPSGEIFVNTIGNSGMATAGCGDVLAGITVSLLAQGYSPEFSAISAVYLHSHAADKAVLKRSEHALIASDIIEEL